MSSKYAHKGEARHPTENSTHNVEDKNAAADRGDNLEAVQQPGENMYSKV